MIPQLIIFDCDGTLVDTEMIYNGVIAEILAEKGYTGYTRERCYKLFTGLTLTNIREKLEAEEGGDFSFLYSDPYINRALDKMDKDGIPAIPGAKDLIDYTSRHFKICVGSNGERSNVLKSLRVNQMLPYFGEEHVFTKTQVERGKPAPDLFLYAAEKMGADPAHTLVIEDSVPGVRAGVAAGMEVYGFIGSHKGEGHEPANHGDILKEAGASRVYDSLIHIARDLKTQKASHQQEGMLAQ